MKKLTARQYAEALYYSAKSAKGEELNKVLKNFVLLLAKHKQFKLANSIIQKFSEIYNEQENLIEAEVFSAKKLGETSQKKIQAWLGESLGKKIAATYHTDEQLLGGFKVKYKDTILDASLKTKLANLQKQLLK